MCDIYNDHKNDSKFFINNNNNDDDDDDDDRKLEIGRLKMSTSPCRLASLFFLEVELEDETLKWKRESNDRFEEFVTSMLWL